jgi:flagellar motility protein MotE (MotC chaperone)
MKNKKIIKTKGGKIEEKRKFLEVQFEKEKGEIIKIEGALAKLNKAYKEKIEKLMKLQAQFEILGEFTDEK